jgi:hypothetical protein
LREEPRDADDEEHECDDADDDHPAILDGFLREARDRIHGRV